MKKIYIITIALLFAQISVAQSLAFIKGDISSYPLPNKASGELETLSLSVVDVCGVTVPYDANKVGLVFEIDLKNFKLESEKSGKLSLSGDLLTIFDAKYNKGKTTIKFTQKADYPADKLYSLDLDVVVAKDSKEGDFENGFSAYFSDSSGNKSNSNIESFTYTIPECASPILTVGSVLCNPDADTYSVSFVSSVDLSNIVLLSNGNTNPVIDSANNIVTLDLGDDLTIVANGNDCSTSIKVDSPEDCSSKEATVLTGFFENGWDNWIAVRKAKRVKNANTPEGLYGIQLRHQGNMVSEKINLEVADGFTIKLSSNALNIKNQKKKRTTFYLEYNNNVKGDKSWKRIAHYRFGIDFYKGKPFELEKTITNVAFSNSVNFRIRANMAGKNNGGYILFDAIEILPLYDEDVLNGLALKMYPNPATSFVFLKNVDTGSDYRIYNHSGILVQSGTDIDSTTEISLGRLPRGVYIVHAHVNGKLISSQLIIE